MEAHPLCEKCLESGLLVPTEEVHHKVVNARLSTAPQKTNEQIAREVISGKWGNGEERRNRLSAAGYNYADIQAIVNKLV